MDSTQLIQRLEQLSQRSADESHLLNRQLPAPHLAVWEGQKGEWRSPAYNEVLDGRVPVRILHLWADYCPPCRAEFPRLKKIDQQLQADYRREVRLVLVSETLDSAAMKKFWAENPTLLPPGLQYGDLSHELMFAILQALPQVAQSATLRVERAPGRELPLPITLILDSDDVVRLAFVGSLEGRYGELINGVEQLYRTVKSRPGLDRSMRNGWVAGRPNDGAKTN